MPLRDDRGPQLAEARVAPQRAEEDGAPRRAAAEGEGQGQSLALTLRLLVLFGSGDRSKNRIDFHRPSTCCAYLLTAVADPLRLLL